VCSPQYLANRQPDQVVIWYPTEAVCVPLDEFERDYRVLDRELIKQVQP
jgi:hypothetical protein